MVRIEPVVLEGCRPSMGLGHDGGVATGPAAATFARGERLAEHSRAIEIGAEDGAPPATRQEEDQP